MSPRPILFGGGLSFPIYNGRPLQSDENIVNGPANACIMVCEHLTGLEQELLRMGIKEVHRGQPWSKNCREWVYFDCCLDLVALRARLDLAPGVIDHIHRGTHDGSEAGLVCTRCWDAIMGAHPDNAANLRTFG